MTSDNTPKAAKAAIAAHLDTDVLLDELLRRKMVVPCEAQITFDGRAVRESRAKILEAVVGEDEGRGHEEVMAEVDRRFSLFVELRLLEVLSKGLAVAKPDDRCHTFTMEPAAGDLPPGSLNCTVSAFMVSATQQV